MDRPSPSPAVPLTRHAYRELAASGRAITAESVVDHYQQVLQSAVATALITLDCDGLITGWSEGAKRLLGWREEEMLGKSLRAIFPSDQADKDVMKTEMADARTAGLGRHEGWRIRRNGEQFWAVGETTPLFSVDGALTGFVKIIRDRTDQRQAEVALEEERRALEILNNTGALLARENDLDALVQAVTDAGVVLTGAEFGAFFYNVVSSAGESYTLYTLSGAPREAFSKFPMPRNTAIFGPTFTGEGIVRSDDITKDPRYGKSAPYYGMPAGHLPVRSYLAVPVISRAGEVLGGLFFGHSGSGRFTDRSERNLEGLAGEAAIAIENARLIDGMQREIQHRKDAEKALHELNNDLETLIEKRTGELQEKADELRQAQKMEVVGQLTGGLAHDFNNLLQIIIGNLETLSRNLPEEMVRLRRAASHAMTGAKRAASLTQRLLAFARRQPLSPKPIDVNALVRGMSELLVRALAETVQLETVLGAGLWKTEVDPNELESALLNLALNARDAMPEGGKLTIETSNAHLDEAYAARHAEVIRGQYVLISVSDTGIGIDQATMARVFEPFFTTKSEGKGTGLGLSQVYGFVKQSGGHIKLYSEVGEGTTVRIYLPRLVGEIETADEHREALVPEAAAEVILVVEDDADVRAYSVETLRDLGYLVIEAFDAPSAILALESGPIDLIFADVVLPNGSTGAQIVARAKELQPGIKSLFTTGYARNAIVHHGRLDAGVHLLTKPFSYDDLAAKIRDILDEN